MVFIVAQGVEIGQNKVGLRRDSLDSPFKSIHGV